MKVLYDKNTEGCYQETVMMKELKLADGRLVLEVPVQLHTMPDSMRESFYPYENCPEVLLADESGKIQLTLQFVGKKLEREETINAAETLRSFMENQQSYSSISPVHFFRDGEIPVGWFVMVLDEVGEFYLHVKAVFSVQSQLCLMTITYPEIDQLEWEMIMKHFFASLHERGGTDESNS